MDKESHNKRILKGKDGLLLLTQKANKGRMGMGDPDRIPDEDIGASADSNEAHTDTVFRPSSSYETPTCFFGSSSHMLRFVP